MSRDLDTSSHIGRVLGPGYRVIASIGAGGMGVVYRGLQLSVNRPVAIKFILASGADSAERLRRFRREAEAMAQLTHPNSVRLYDFGVTETHELYLVMELLQGVDLAQKLKDDSPMLPLDALNIARQVLLALVEAHGLGIVHRDLKPSNVFLSQAHGDVVAKVMDFGVAGIDHANAAENTKLTRTGAILGTPEYIAPEQAHGRKVDARADLYALGVMLFEMLTGQLPFSADTALGLLIAHTTQPAPRLAEVAPHLRAETALQALIDDLLAKTPDARPDSALSVIKSIDAICQDLRLENQAPARSRPSQPSVLARVRSSLSSLSSSQLELAPSLRRKRNMRLLRRAGGALLGGLLLSAAALIATRMHEPPAGQASTLQPITQLAATPIAANATLHVSTNSPNAALYINSELWGALAVDKVTTLTLEPGSYDFEARTPDSVTAAEMVTLSAGAPVTIQLDFTPKAGAVHGALGAAEPSPALSVPAEPSKKPQAAVAPEPPVPVVTSSGRYLTDTNTVSDMQTGLVWQRHPTNVCSPHALPSVTGCTWAQARAYCASRQTQNRLGYSGWRLPSLAELKTLVETGRRPAIDAEAFPSTPQDWFWTSTPYRDGIDGAWLVDFTNGLGSSISATYTAHVRCVR